MSGVRIPGQVKGFFIDRSRDHSRDATVLCPLDGRFNELDRSRSGAFGGPACSNAAQRSFQRIENRDSAPANDRSPSVVALQGGNRKGRSLATGFPLEHRNRPDHDRTTRAPHNGEKPGL